MADVFTAVLCPAMSAGAAGMSVCLYMLHRNELVYRYRRAVLGRRDWHGVYHRLPSYETMLWQLWRFDWGDYLDGRTQTRVPAAG